MTRDEHPSPQSDAGGENAHPPGGPRPGVDDTPGRAPFIFGVVAATIQLGAILYFAYC